MRVKERVNRIDIHGITRHNRGTDSFHHIAHFHGRQTLFKWIYVMKLNAGDNVSEFFCRHILTASYESQYKYKCIGHGETQAGYILDSQHDITIQRDNSLILA